MPDCPCSDKVDKLFTDMYLGEGKDNPSVTVRLDRLEQCTHTMVENSKATRETVRRGVLTVIITVLSGVLITIICVKLGLKP